MTQSSSEALSKQDFLLIGRNAWLSQQISLKSKNENSRTHTD